MMAMSDASTALPAERGDRGGERTVPGETRLVAESAQLFLYAEMAQSMRDSMGVEVATTELQGVGSGVGGRLVTRLTAARGPVATERNAMKFVCKELWAHLFRKPASRLQTDRRGNYIIHDNSFRWLSHFSALPPATDLAGANAGAAAAAAIRSGAEAELQEAVMLHLAMPCGIIRGGLLAMGIECSVASEVSLSALPACSFTVTLLRPQASADASTGAL